MLEFLLSSRIGEILTLCKRNLLFVRSTEVSANKGLAGCSRLADEKPWPKIMFEYSIIV
jgi:hypothetical protein